MGHPTVCACSDWSELFLSHGFTTLKPVETRSVASTGSLHTVYMTPDNPGIWKVLCETTSHLTGGMETTYTVRENCGRSTSAQASDTIRRYFIAAVEETWDYAPSGRDILEGKALEDSEYVSV